MNIVPIFEAFSQQVHSSQGCCFALPLSIVTHFETVLNFDLFLPDSRLVRMNRFRNRNDRLRTAGAEIFLRALLSHRLGTTPKTIPLSQVEHKKLRMEDSSFLENYKISLAHSGDWITLAFSTLSEVGIDVEEINKMTLDITDTILSPKERDLFQTCTQDGVEYDKKTHLTAFWVGKEAYTKMTGLGISASLKKIELQIPKMDVLSKVTENNLSDASAWVAVGKLDQKHLWAVSTEEENHTFTLYSHLRIVDQTDFEQIIHRFN